MALLRGTDSKPYNNVGWHIVLKRYDLVSDARPG
jgi:hypothetical protein